MDRQECIIPVDGHSEYWLSIQLPVIGIVCILDEEKETVRTAYWIDIKKYLSENRNTQSIRFEMNQSNEFNKNKFRKYFFYLINKKLPDINFEEALDLLNSSEKDKLLALDKMTIHYADRVDCWEIVFRLYEKKDSCIKEHVFFESISYVFSHPDHWYRKGIYEFSAESSQYVIDKVKQFSKEDIIRALGNIQYHFYDRGTPGQTIEIIIGNINEAEVKLLDIILDESIDVDIRFDAEAILAFQNQDFYISKINQIERMKSEVTDIILDAIRKFGY